MYQLDNPIQPYPWGSRTAIAEILGRPSPSPTPEAELWLGAHPTAPSRVQVDDRWVALDTFLTNDADRLLSPFVAKRFDRCLPFLFKILAAAEPLSIQTHPDAATARAGFIREQKLEVAPERRNYRDSHHKPELLYALTPFSALCGLRPPHESSQLVRALSVPSLDPLLRTLDAADDPPDAIRSALSWLLEHPHVATLVEHAATAAATASETTTASRRRAYETVMMLAERYPNDPGALVSLLLNRVDLSPGEAIFLAAGTLHAYLGGVGLELMANSDNVIRAGCTSKHIDTTELLRVGRFAPAPPTTVTPIGPEDGATVWAPPVEELRLTRLDIDDQRTVTAAGPQIWLCLTGSAVLTSDRYPTLDLTRGQSVFKAADSGAVTIRGHRATVFCASVAPAATGPWEPDSDDSAS